MFSQPFLLPFPIDPESHQFSMCFQLPYEGTGKCKDCVYLYLQTAGGAEPWCAVVSSGHHEGVLGSLRPPQRGSCL